MDKVLQCAPLLAWSGYEPSLAAGVIGGLYVTFSMLEDKRLRQKSVSAVVVACGVLVSLASAAALAGIVIVEFARRP